MLSEQKQKNYTLGDILLYKIMTLQPQDKQQMTSGTYSATPGAHYCFGSDYTKNNQIKKTVLNCP